MRIIKVFAWLLLAVIAAALVAVLVLAIDHSQPTVLPKPTGSYAVGRTILGWKDPGRVDAMAADHGSATQLIAWIWYPADLPSTGSSPPAPYMPDRWRLAVEHKSGFLLSKLVSRDLSRVRTNSTTEAGLSTRRQVYPIVLLRAGLAALSVQYSALAEDLASHGYVVVALDAPYRTFVTVLPDGDVVERARRNDADRLTSARQEELAIRLVNAWSTDLSYALDRLTMMNDGEPAGRFTGRLDLSRVGVVGHSLGGATALQFCHDDRRCRATIDIDGAPLGRVINEGMNKPTMFILGDHRGDPATETRQVTANIEAIYSRVAPAARAKVMLPGASHFMFSDAAFVQLPVAMKALHAAGLSKLDGDQQIASTRLFERQFLDRYLGSKVLDQDVRNK